MTLFYEWNYDTETVMEYQRSGKCNQCGECCKAGVEFIITSWLDDFDSRNGGTTTTGRGVWFSVGDGDNRRFWQVRKMEPGTTKCKSLAGNGTCAWHPNKERKCSDWPMHPSLVKPFKDCSYVFEKLTSWNLSELE